MTVGGDERARLSRLAANGASQGLSSATNFLFGVITAATFSPSGLGWFAIALGVHYAAVFVIRAATSEAYIARGEADFNSAISAAVLLSIPFGLSLIALSTWAASEAALSILIVGVSMPILVGHEAARAMYLGSGDQRSAVLLDTIWWTVFAVALAVWALGVATGAAFWTATWGLGGATGFLVVVGLSGFRPSLGWFSWPHLSDTAALLGIEAVMATAIPRLSFVAIGVVASIDAVGAVRAGQVLASPLNFVFLASPLFLVPEFKRLAGADPFRRLFRQALIAMSGVVCLWLAVVLVLPDGLGERLMGKNYEVGRGLAIWFFLRNLGRALTQVSSSSLRAVGDMRSTSRARAASAVPMLLCAVLGAEWWSAAGAVVAIALVEAFAGLYLYLKARRITCQIESE